MNCIYERINLKFVFKIKLHINEEVCDVNRLAGWYSPPQRTIGLSVTDMELHIVPLLDYKKAHNKCFHSFSLFSPTLLHLLDVCFSLLVGHPYLFVYYSEGWFNIQKALNFETFLIFPCPNLIKKLRCEYWIFFEGFSIWNMRDMLYWAS